MANTLNGLGATLIANTGLNQFKKMLIPMKVFSTDFSAEASSAATITTRVIPQAGTAVALSTVGYDRSNSAVCPDITTTAVTVSMSDVASGFILLDSDIEAINAEASNIHYTVHPFWEQEGQALYC